MTKKFFKFDYIPSGVTPDKFKNLKAYITEEVNEKNSVLKLDDKSLEIRTKSKTIVITQSDKSYHGRLLDLNIYKTGNFFEGTIFRALASFAYLNRMKSKIPPAGPVLVTLDSGVFQNFNHGTEIDLKSLALCYNQNGDEGMVRDYIPEYCKSYHPDKMKELAIKQSGDTKKLKKLIKREDFNLINIIQGRNYQELKAWLDIVYDPDLSDMAIGSQSKSVIAVLPMLAHLIFDKKIKRLHFLGFNSHRQIILLALVSQYIDVTIDGSEAVNLSFKLRIMWTLLPEGRLHKTWVGNSPSPDKLRSLGGQSACNCRACQIVPLLGAYQDDKDMVASLLFMHNQSMHNQFVDLWTNWINNDSKKALEQYIRAFGGELLQCNYQKRAKLRKEFVVIKNYLELVATKGTKEAQRAYSSYL